MGIVAKSLEDPYEHHVRWLKIKNPDYSQKEGRGASYLIGAGDRAGKLEAAPVQQLDADNRKRRAG